MISNLKKLLPLSLVMFLGFSSLNSTGFFEKYKRVLGVGVAIAAVIEIYKLYSDYCDYQKMINQNGKVILQEEWENLLGNMHVDDALRLKIQVQRIIKFYEYPEEEARYIAANSEEFKETIEMMKS